MDFESNKCKILFSTIVIAIMSCRGQSSGSYINNQPKSETALGVIVNHLSDSLWYVYQDKKNNYWFGSNGEGVFCYDGKTILNYTIKDGLCNDSIRQIQEDEYGNMYFSTLSGINKFDGKTITSLTPIKSDDWKLEKDDMWFCMLGKRGEHGPYRYDGKNLYNLQFPKHYLHDEIYAQGINPFFSPYEIYCIYKDRKGAMWFGTSVFGACRFDGKSVKWMYDRDLTIAPNGGTFGIRSIFEDQEGKFWLCNTLQRFSFDEEKTEESDRLVYEKLSGIGDEKTFDGDKLVYYSHIVEDDHGAIWLTTWDQGVYKYDGKNITCYKVQDQSKDVNLISMHKDNTGVLWLGTPSNGAYRFNGSSFERYNP